MRVDLFREYADMEFYPRRLRDKILSRITPREVLLVWRYVYSDAATYQFIEQFLAIE